MTAFRRVRGTGITQQVAGMGGVGDWFMRRQLILILTEDSHSAESDLTRRYDARSHGHHI